MGAGQSLCASTGGMGPVNGTERSMIGLFLWRQLKRSRLIVEIRDFIASLTF